MGLAAGWGDACGSGDRGLYTEICFAGFGRVAGYVSALGQGLNVGMTFYG